MGFFIVREIENKGVIDILKMFLWNEMIMIYVSFLSLFFFYVFDGDYFFFGGFYSFRCGGFYI